MQFFKFISVVIIFFELCESEKIRYLSTEHATTVYVNSKYVTYANLTSRRYGRTDPVYYIGFNVESIYPVNNNVSAHFYFYELLTNRYRRGFVEMHFLVCDLLEKDQFVGTALRQAMPNSNCPLPAGVYKLANMTMPSSFIPKSFPFTKGRIYANITATKTEEVLISIFVDMEIKEKHVRNYIRFAPH